MTRLSIELVPRSASQLDADLHQLKCKYPSFAAVNIPDLLRMPVRAWQGCVQARHYVPVAIPHLRAIDVDLAQGFKLKNYIRKHKLNELLVVRGDPPADGSVPTFDTSSVDLIRAIKSEMSEVRVYAALDPYRTSMDEELAYCREKIQAGVDGFFTQPFFDLALMQQYAESMQELDYGEIFWGVSPVVGEKSQAYWERVNRVDFPADFSPDLSWNKAFAKTVLKWVKARGDSIYFMPIRVDLEQYFRDLLY